MALAGPARLALGWAKSEDLIQPILMPPKPAVYHPKPFCYVRSYLNYRSASG
jgi:hypothetical protein